MTVVALLSTATGAAAGPAATLQTGGIVSGRVIESTGMQGVPDVQIVLIGPMEGQAERALASFPLMAAEIAERLGIAQIPTSTDGNGRFTFDGRAPGLYALLFRRDGYFGPAKPGNPPTSAFVTSTVTVTAGSPPPDVVITMIRAATIRGTVRDVQGRPVASARVVLVGESAIGRNVGTDADGAFTIVTAPDSYKVLALKAAPTGPLIGANLATGELVSRVRSTGQPITVGEGEQLTIEVVAD